MTCSPLNVKTHCEMIDSRRGLDGVQQAIDRGDFPTRASMFRAKLWLACRRRHLRRSWLRSPAGIATRQAQANEFANVVNLLLLVVTLLAALRVLP
jgi:hypothetical protein